MIKERPPIQEIIIIVPITPMSHTIRKIIINHIRVLYDHVGTITINNNKSFECVVTTHRAKVTLKGAPFDPQPKSEYDLV
jgi:hypothetical protein